ncbi:hypothetical protein BJY00DRAFT_286329 [Aspergillus carlsbadensis]|nr:hypothetical protein BJY00DRAFT_286329 [Aspergillus carlsbadensis]
MKIKNESYFQPWAQQHVSHKYPALDSGISDRLSAAMARQKAILKYRERHRQKLTKGLFECVETESTKLSATEATEILPATEQLYSFETASNSGASQTSYATSLMTTQDAISIPSPPRESQDGTPFECPYCFHVITIKHEKDWSRHVFRDLMPYVCLAKDCITPTKLYESRRSWYEHMRDVHSFGNTGEEGPVCPLCRLTAPSLDKHVGRHLEELALFVLPRIDRAESTYSEHSSVSIPDGEQYPDDTAVGGIGFLRATAPGNLPAAGM